MWATLAARGGRYNAVVTLAVYGSNVRYCLAMTKTTIKSSKMERFIDYLRIVELLRRKCQTQAIEVAPARAAPALRPIVNTKATALECLLSAVAIVIRKTEFKANNSKLTSMSVYHRVILAARHARHTRPPAPGARAASIPVQALTSRISIISGIDVMDYFFSPVQNQSRSVYLL
ncbi:hypothetical protein EVAR_29804_1 [Eumeta japonica]|uniref:Uncharacterized protein n=1 Tax=Eumeta variegata TaxID=151549 RepID=A0A4C1XPR0_EUMVA|nr:hypothetical protein EVAR_29804_1 [Eumeta japonica]